MNSVKIFNQADFNRFLPLLAPLAVYFLDEAYFFRPKFIYAAVCLIIAVLFFAVWRFCRESRNDKQWWNYLILPSVISVSTAAYTVFLTSKSVTQILFFLNLLFLYFYFRHIYYYLLNPALYEVFSIENISSYLGWFSFFLISAVIYGLQSFLNIFIFQLVMILLAFSALIIYQILWSNKIEFEKGLPYILIGCFILAELCWSISILPFNYNILGLCLAICFYVISGLIKNHLLDKLDAKAVKMYLAVGISSLFLILLTSSWI
ncbi:MAG: hypothetical protein V1667_00815 [bacterium]